VFVSSIKYWRRNQNTFPVQVYSSIYTDSSFVFYSFVWWLGWSSIMMSPLFPQLRDVISSMLRKRSWKSSVVAFWLLQNYRFPASSKGWVGLTLLTWTLNQVGLCLLLSTFVSRKHSLLLKRQSLRFSFFSEFLASLGVLSALLRCDPYDCLWFLLLAIS